MENNYGSAGSSGGPSPTRQVVPAQVVDFSRQVFVDGALDAGEEEFGSVRAVEVAIEIGRGPLFEIDLP
jgi:hypothetical protein